MTLISTVGPFLVAVLTVVAIPLLLLFVLLAVVISRFVFQEPDHRWAADDDTRLRRVFRAIHDLGYAKLSTARRHSLVRLVTQIRRPAPPGVLGTLAGLTVYACCVLCVPVAAAVLWLGMFVPHRAPKEALARPTPFMSGKIDEGFQLACDGSEPHSRVGPAAADELPITWIFPRPTAAEAAALAASTEQLRERLGEPARDQLLSRVVAWDRLVFASGGRPPEKPAGDTTRHAEGASPPRPSQVPAGGFVRSDVSHEGVAVALVCRGPDPASAAALASTLDDYLGAPPFVTLRPPWAPAPPLDEAEAAAQSRAWQTYRALQVADAKAPPVEALSRWKLWWAMRSESKDPAIRKAKMEERRNERMAKRRARLEQVIAAARVGTELDEETVDLYRDARSGGFGPPAMEAAHKLGARLGQPPLTADEHGFWRASAADEAHTMSGSPKLDGNDVWIPYASFAVLDTGLPEVAGFLCARDCKSVEYWIRQNTAAEDEED